MPSSTTPAGPPRLALAALRYCPHVTHQYVNLQDDEGSDATPLSGLNHTASALAVYASQPGLPRDHARLASGWWPAISGRAFHTRGTPSERFPHCLLLLPPLPGFAWRDLVLVLVLVPGGPRGLLPRGSHRPVRAAFPHTVPQVTGSLRHARPSGLREPLGGDISSAPTASSSSSCAGRRESGA